jgi:hypothetical protein
MIRYPAHLLLTATLFVGSGWIAVSSPHVSAAPLMTCTVDIERFARPLTRTVTAGTPATSQLHYLSSSIGGTLNFRVDASTAASGTATATVDQTTQRLALDSTPGTATSVRLEYQPYTALPGPTGFIVRSVDPVGPGTVNLQLVVTSAAGSSESSIAITQGVADLEAVLTDAVFAPSSFVQSPGATAPADLSAPETMALTITTADPGQDWSIGTIEAGCTGVNVPTASSTCPYVLDPFTGSQAIHITSDPTISAGMRVSGAIGGAREFTMETIIARRPNSAVMSAGDDSLTVAHGSARTTTRVVWDGFNDDPTSPDSDGLGHLDFSNVTSLSFDSVGSDADVTMSLTVGSSANDSSSQELTLTSVSSALAFEIADFAPRTGSGVDWSAVSYIALEMTPDRISADWSVGPFVANCNATVGVTTTTTTTTTTTSTTISTTTSTTTTTVGTTTTPSTSAPPDTTTTTSTGPIATTSSTTPLPAGVGSNVDTSTATTTLQSNQQSTPGSQPSPPVKDSPPLAADNQDTTSINPEAVKALADQNGQTRGADPASLALTGQATSAYLLLSVIFFLIGAVLLVVSRRNSSSRV